MKIQQKLKQLFKRYGLCSRKPYIRQKSRQFADWYIYEYKKTTRPENDPERLALEPYCLTGVGLDIGCGSHKTTPNCIGVDITDKGDFGQAGNQEFEESQADFKMNGDNLHMFNDKHFDFVIARHNLEHYIDYLKALQEWKRVLKCGGTLGIICPDEDCIDTIHLDNTHKHVFTRESLERAINLIGGFRIIKNEVCVKDWSFVIVAKKER